MSGSSPVSTRKSSFAPVVAPDTRVLVLGSLPGEESLKAQRYYAHPRNRFWHLVGKVIGTELEPLAYEDRLAALLAAKIGLWDTVASARRKGSLDAAIRDAELAESLPGLRAVAFNGATAARIGSKLLSGSRAELVPLPSSSPAHAAMKLAENERLWRRLSKFLE